MKTRTSEHTREDTSIRYVDEGERQELETLSDDELERMLFEEDTPAPSGFWNFPTIAGLSLIVVGVAYIFQELGLWNGFDLRILAEMLPWLAGVLIILLGFGVLSWRPRKKRRATKRSRRRSDDASIAEAQEDVAEPRKRLKRSRNKKIAGVAAGIAEYFNLDPTLVRIAFVIGMIASGGPPLILAYVVMAVVMPEPDSVEPAKRITIVKSK